MPAEQPGSRQGRCELGRRKQRVHDEGEDRRFGPLPLAVSAATVLLCGAISYNALIAQKGHAPTAGGMAAATTRVDVNPGGPAPGTIQLKYDPVVEDVQRELKVAGFYKGVVDGVVGRRTKEAIAAYQQSSGLDVTGEPSQELVEHIRYTRQVSEAMIFTGSVEPAPDAEQRAQVRRVQTALSELAYYQGQITGEMSDATHQAIGQFEREHGMSATGEISDGLMRELSKVSGQSDAANP